MNFVSEKMIKFGSFFVINFYVLLFVGKVFNNFEFRYKNLINFTLKIMLLLTIHSLNIKEFYSISFLINTNQNIKRYL